MTDTLDRLVGFPSRLASVHETEARLLIERLTSLGHGPTREEVGEKISTWKFRCPTHDDLNRPLVVIDSRNGSGRWTVACHGHCALGDVALAVGLPGTSTAEGEGSRRSLRVTPASAMRILRVRFLWDRLLPLGTLTLLAGREGIGKSTLGYTVVADVTRGRLPGEHHGKPRSVLIVATEDPWEHVIVPRLVAADADLDRVYRVEVTEGGKDRPVVLPVDLTELARVAAETDAALVLLDPLMSRLDAGLDSHKDAEVRQALEPLSAFAERSGVTVLGVIHVNKGKGDAVTSVMGSRAFAAVARAVLFVVKDPDDPALRHVGMPKANLAPTDGTTRRFRIDTAVISGSEDMVSTGRLVWDGVGDRSVDELVEANSDGGSEDRSALADAEGWLRDYLAQVGGTEESSKVKAAARKDGHADRTLARARQRARIVAQRIGQPPSTWWSLPEAVVDAKTSADAPTPGETSLNGTTGTTEGQEPVVPVVPIPGRPSPAGTTGVELAEPVLFAP